MNEIDKEYKAKYGKELGKGELEMITLAVYNNADFVVNTASNNLRDIATYIASNQINNITTMEVLCLLYESKLKTLQELEELKKFMEERRRKLPKESVQEYYQNTYKKKID